MLQRHSCARKHSVFAIVHGKHGWGDQIQYQAVCARVPVFEVVSYVLERLHRSTQALPQAICSWFIQFDGGRKYVEDWDYVFLLISDSFVTKLCNALLIVSAVTKSHATRLAAELTLCFSFPTGSRDVFRKQAHSIGTHTVEALLIQMLGVESLLV